MSRRKKSHRSRISFGFKATLYQMRNKGTLYKAQWTQQKRNQCIDPVILVLPGEKRTLYQIIYQFYIGCHFKIKLFDKYYLNKIGEICEKI